MPNTLEKAKLALGNIISDPDLSFDETIAALQAIKAEADRLLAIADPVVQSSYASIDHKHNYAPNFCTECGKRNPDWELYAKE